MTFVRSFDDARPPQRFDGVAFTSVRIQESASSAGPWTTLETKALSPVDPDPADPLARDLTTSLATLESGWYRLSWVDPGANEYQTAAIQFAPAPAYRPTVAEVAALERTRTVGPTSGGLGGDTGPEPVTTFTSDTRPTAAEVEGLIDQAMEAVLGQLAGAAITEPYYSRTRHLVALYTAILIEGSFFREQLDEGSVALWRSLFASGIQALRDDLGTGGTAGGRRVDSVVLTGVYDDPLAGVVVP